MKRGIALGGGGARGAYEMGALKALKEMGYLKDLDMISGVSVGSINASVVAMDMLDQGENFWLSNRSETIFSQSSSVIKTLLDKKLTLLDKGFYETKALEALMDDLFDFDKIRQKKVLVGVSYVGDENTGFFELIKANLKYVFENKKGMHYINLKSLSDEDIKKTILASCAIPMMFKPVIIDGKKYYDGGMYERLPITPLVENKCDEVIAIDLFRLSFKRKAQIEDTKIIHIHPSKNLGRIMDFSKEKNQQRFEIGYLDAKKAMHLYEVNSKEA